MATSKITYNGQLRTTATHLQSGIQIISDAPLDNQGKGEAFSPTDLMATSLASCMFTIMGITANTHGINIASAEAQLTKIMATEPRRVSAIHITFNFPDAKNYSDKDKKILAHAALNCPVYHSLHPDIQKIIDFGW
ncbi:MAG: OsmC family peroxiredoxin [Sphingobacteriales bacterium]|nr:MAG: OsmC family peroxiredoxin [Sphingobacteriales bacterium]TAF82817.1 MAG: OsmC family peroxiredoxin [Sphingobacteriales bacterium]